jgi:hypothetical protein
MCRLFVFGALTGATDESAGFSWPQMFSRALNAPIHAALLVSEVCCYRKLSELQKVTFLVEMTD